MNQSDEIFKKYWLTITICAIFFILLVVFYILNWVKNKKKKNAADGESAYCPDYWTIGSETSKNVTCIPPSTSTGATAKESCLKNNKTWKTNKDKKTKCQWAKNCQQQWYGIWDDSHSSC